MEIREYTVFNENEILELYSKAGWTAYTKDMKSLRQGFEHSLLVLGAFEKDKLVGIIRAVGDGFTVVLIQDLLILPECRRKGIGSELVRELLERYEDVRQIQLVTDDVEENIAFYKSLGFIELSEDGCLGLWRIK